MATSSTNFVTALGAGSGIDIKALAQSLVDAEQTPRKDRIDAKIKVSEAKVSGYGALKYSLSQLKTSFETLNDARDFSSLSANNTQPTAFAVTTTTNGQPAGLNIEVSQVAKPQRMTSQIFADKTSSLSGVSAPFDITFTDANGSQNIQVTTATPDGIANAINASTSSTGLTAQWINTGQGYQLVVTGKPGLANGFGLTSGALDTTVNNVTQNAFSTLQSAQNAQLSIDGIAITSSSNEITDVVQGVNLSLYTPTQGAAKVDITRQSSTIRDNLNALVKAYNDFQDSVKVLQDPSSKVDTYGGALQGDTLTRQIQSQVRSFFTENAKPAGQFIKAGRDVGLTLDRFGKLSLDENKLNQALSNHFDEVVTMFTANKNDKSLYGTSDAGLAGGAVRTLDQMLRSNNLIDQQTNNENRRITNYKSDLDKLQTQMDQLLQRYINQFTVMDNLVSSSNSTRQSLKNSLQQLSGSTNGN